MTSQNFKKLSLCRKFYKFIYNLKNYNYNSSIFDKFYI